MAYRICNSEGVAVLDKSADLCLESKREELSLGAGKYTLKICAKSSYADVKFTLALGKRVYTKTLHGLEKYEAKSNFGSGSWSSSNKKVVKVSNAIGSSTTFIPVSVGKATITFKSGAYTATYKVTVKKVTKTIKKKVSSCDFLTLEPKQGKGTWKSGNRKIVAPTTKKVAKIVVKVKEKGTTTVTFKSALATYYYKLTVTSKKSYPIDRGYMLMYEDGAIEPHVLISNNTKKTIKYVAFRAYYYNAVGDPAYYNGQNYEDLQYIGPLKPWGFEWAKWSPVFTNYTVNSMKIKKATVIYMDGTQKEVKVNRTFYFNWD